ncbi:MAG: hypothetical protein ABI681_03680 [Gemmatimonadales bacterium]
MLISMRSKVLLFITAIVLGGLGGALGSIVGHAFGQSGLFAGGIIGGLLAAVATGRVASSRGWVPPSRRKAVAMGAAAGFLAATAVAVNTLSSPVGPVLSTLLIGAGALVGTRAARE